TDGPRMIENQVGHADDHVLLDVGLKLWIYLVENLGRRGISYRLTAQNAATNRHDERSRHAFAGNIRDSDAEPFVVDLDIIKIIAADLARGHVDSADLKSVHVGRFSWKQNALNVARDFQVVVEPLLFVRLGINDGVVERERRLLGERFETDERRFREARAASPVGEE